MLSGFHFSSNTTAGCANQHYFETDGETRVGRAYFKIFAGGEYNYSLLFSGLLDSSYRRLSFPDEPCADWTIHRARVGRLKAFPDDRSPESITEEAVLAPEWLASLTFDGKPSKRAEPALFATDPVRLSFKKDEYLCLELEYSGKRIPCLCEAVVPIYNLRSYNTDEACSAQVGRRRATRGTADPTRAVTSGASSADLIPQSGSPAWEYSVNMPLPCMIGCDRKVKERIAYLGDSITQGADMAVNSYGHWLARLAELLSPEYSHWNLGIGYGKASDAASGGVWFKKSLAADTVFVCYGVNDVNSDFSAELIKSNLSAVVTRLKALGKRVVIQTVPPFNYPEPRRTVWREVNRFITEELSKIADRTFDPNYILSLSEEEPHLARYGGHPAPEGCAIWANDLAKALISHGFDGCK